MSKYVKQPTLSTGFSESGKSAERRFDNILNTKAKKTGVLAFGLILILVGIIGAMVACNTNKNESQATRTQPWRNNGTAIITKDIDLFSDSQGTNKITTLKENDLVYVIYHEQDNSIYVQLAFMSSPSVQGYIENDVISFDESRMKNANYGSVISENIYKSPNENDIYHAGFTTTFYIVEQNDEWTKVNLWGRDDGRWVKTSDISYELTPYQIDLTYLDLQREVDNGHQPWRLDPLEVARDYVYNTLNKNGGEFKVFYTNDSSPTISYSYTKPGEKELQVVVYKPIKKDNSGIWVVNKGTLMRNQIENVIPLDRQVDGNSNAAWRIKVTKDMKYNDPETGIDFNLEQEAKKFGINIFDYYGRDLDVFIYSVETSKYSSQQYTSSPYIFIFEGTNMVAYKDLEKQENEEFARNILTTLNKYRSANE